ncbi:MAG: hypothetical protein MKZ70_09335, partial [Opitutales bacterium]|nr:hypothetical protein [Opitutales bacterium]
MNRRQFIERSVTAGMGLSLGSRLVEAAPAKTTQLDADGFFTLGRVDGRWLLITPEGKPFFTLGMNHIDPATLRYPENIHIWRNKYDGSTLKWIQESVVPNLKHWGFNSVGWVQEVTVRKWRHSRPFTVDEYKVLEMPYCQLLPLLESHQWEKHTVHFDFFRDDWAEWV